MATRRRYSKADKIAAITAAELTTATAAAEATGIPETNIRRWQDDPELAEYGAKTREELSAGARALANLAVARLLLAVKENRLEPRDLLTAFGLAVDKSQLLTGEATARTESRALTEGLDDHERAALRRVLDEAARAAVAPKGGNQG